MKFCCDDMSMQSSRSRFPGASTIDRDAVVKMTFCIIFSSISLGFFISWILRCVSDPDEDVSFDNVIYFYSGCSRYQGHQGWSVPALAYCIFYSWNTLWSLVCLLFLLGVAQFWVRLSCSMLVMGSITIVLMGGISLYDTWNNKEYMYSSYPKTYRTHRVWESMFLQLVFLIGQFFIYGNSIWDAWFRNNADVTVRSSNADVTVRGSSLKKRNKKLYVE